MSLNLKDLSYERCKSKIIAFLILCSSILILDMFFGITISKEVVKHIVYFERPGGGYRNGVGEPDPIFGIITNKREYPLRNASLYNDSEKGDTITVSKSKILKEIIQLKRNGTEYKNAGYSIYSFYRIFPIIYIFSSLYAFIAYRRQWPWLDFFVILASILSLYLIFSFFFNKII